jgi:hypothetical protein
LQKLHSANSDFEKKEIRPGVVGLQCLQYKACQESPDTFGQRERERERERETSLTDLKL